MSANTDPRVLALLSTLAQVTRQPFTNNAYLGSLRQMLGLSADAYRNNVSTPIYGELESSQTNTSSRYKVLVMAYAVSKTSNNGYDYGSQFIKQNTSPSLSDKLDKEASKIAAVLYRQYLEQGLANFNQSYSFLGLFQDGAFCRAFTAYVLQDSFINDQLLAIYAGGNKDYAQAVAYLYERMRGNLSQMKEIVVPLVGGKTPQEVSRFTAADHWVPIAQEHSYFAGNPAALREFNDLSLPLKWSNEDVLQIPSFPAIGTSFSNEFIMTPEIHDVASGATGKSSDSSSFPPAIPFGGMPPPPTVTTTYGKDLVDWMNSLADNGYGDVFNHGSAHQTEHVESPFGGSCFKPGTKVILSSGEKPIEALVAGDTVLTKGPDHFGALSDEQVKWPVSKGLWLYGFNDDEPFFTPGHVFFTKAGPKAVKPELALQENPDVKVNRLHVGDILLQFDGHAYKEVKIRNFTCGPAKCSHVHGLHFRKSGKGTCSYHANGYLVAANYPEITIQRLKDNFAKLSVKEQGELSRTIKDLPDSLKAVFGPSLTSSFESTFGDQNTSLADQFEATKARLKRNTEKRHFDASKIVRSFPLVHWENFQKQKSPLRTHHADFHTHVKHVNGQHKLPHLTLSEGALLADGHLVEHADVSAKEIHWSRPLHSGEWEHGFLKTSGDGMFLHGAVGHGPAPPSAQVSSKSTPDSSPTSSAGAQPANALKSSAAVPASAVKNTVHVLAASHANDYPLLTGSTQYDTSNAASVAKYPGSEKWTDFYKVETSLTVTNKGLYQVTVTMPDLDRNWGDAEDPLYSTTAAVDTNTWTLKITIMLIQNMEEFLLGVLDPSTWKGPDGKSATPPPPFFIIQMNVNLATNFVAGSYSELVSPKKSTDPYTGGKFHAIYCSYSPKAAAVKSTALNAIATTRPSIQSSKSLATTANLVSTSANIHASPSPATAHLKTFTATSNDNLPIGPLQSLSTPADIDLHAHSQNYMIAACGYWRGPDEIKVFGDESSSIAKSLPNSLKGSLSADSQDFLKNKFSKSLLNYSMSRNKSYSDKFNDARKDKLQYWWTGKAKNCLSNQQGYNNVTVITAGQAFDDLVDQDTFNPYLTSTTDYADQLFEAVTDDSILENLSVSVILGNQNLVNRYCAILNALDRKHRGFDAQLWNLVRDKQIYQLASGYPQYDDTISDFLKRYLIDLQNKIASGDQSISDDMKKELQFDLDQMKTDLDAKDIADLAFKTFDRSTELGLNILQVMDQFKRRPGGTSNMPAFLTALEKKLNDSPKLKIVFTSLKGILMIGMQAATVFFSIGYLMKWDSLSDAQRAVAVLTTLEATLRGIYELVQTYKELRGLSPDSLQFKIRTVRWARASAKRVTAQETDPNQNPVLDDQKVATVQRIAPDGEINPEIPEKSTNQQIAEAGVASEPQAAKKIPVDFDLGAAVVEGVQVALNIATAVLLGIELKDEWDHVPDSIRALDTINLMVQCVQAATGLIGLVAMVVGAEFAALPVVGVLVCLAGLVMMLVEQFYPRPKPDPVQDYLNDHGYSYVDGLDSSPVPELSYQVSKSYSGSQVTLQFQVTQPANLNPVPMVKQFMTKVYAGTTSTDLFLPPTTDANTGNVTGNDIVWSMVTTDNSFEMDGNDNPDPNDHSLLGTVYPTVAAVIDDKEPSKTTPGTSIIGTKTLTWKVTGTLNSSFTSMQGSVSEILANPPTGIASSDVLWLFTINK